MIGKMYKASDHHFNTYTRQTTGWQQRLMNKQRSKDRTIRSGSQFYLKTKNQTGLPKTFRYDGLVLHTEQPHIITIKHSRK